LICSSEVAGQAHYGPGGHLRDDVFGIAARLSIAVLLAIATAYEVRADEHSPIHSLRAKFPHGIPWRVEFTDSTGKSLGAIDMQITSQRGDSCLGDMNPDGVRVEFVRKDNLSPTLPTTSYGVAKFNGNKVRIDLTGGMCDAYLLIDGEIAADGSSKGTVSAFGMQGGHDVATYHATVR
jgi:hypothetical protein